MKYLPAIDRLKARITPKPSGCWEVDTKARHDFGYVVLKSHGKQVYAHRLMYEHAIGPIASGQVVRHSCDNPGCVNPAHLLLGTHGDNARIGLNGTDKRMP